MKVVFEVIWSWENVKKFTAVSFKKYKDLNQAAFFRFLTNHYRKYLQKLNVMIRFTKLKLTINIDLYSEVFTSI